jgi:undecaprenyl diphosphate synthase
MHIAIIMDGNGRWANRQGLPRHEGHRAGAVRVREIVEECVRRKLEQLTLYCFSSENWKRPHLELDLLMNLFREYLKKERENLVKNDIRFSVIGRRTDIPEDVLAEMDTSMALTKNNKGLHLCLAVNYGSRGEIADAVKKIVEKKILPDQIDEQCISNHLYTAGMSDPDLLIRTAGELRLSNYLLWQLSYAEIWVTEKCWPDFDVALFDQALKDFAQRKRKFGGLDLEP